MASNFDQETFDFILKDNKVNEEKFNIFHKEFFNGMLDQFLFWCLNYLMIKENDQVLVNLKKNLMI